MALRSSTATSLLYRTLRATSSPFPSPTSLLLLEPSAHRIPRVESRAASSSTPGGGDPPAPMDSPTIKVVSHLRDAGGGGGAGAAIDAGGSARKPLSLWPGMYHSPVTSALWEARSSIFERKMDVGYSSGAAAGPQTELLTKTPARSRTTIVYKFAADDILREQYRDPWNQVRIGKLLEDLDALAGTIAVKVDVGDFLRFKSCVLYTQLENKWQPLVNVEVVAHVTRPELRKSEISNTFHFTFSVSSDVLKNGLTIRNVVPSTEEEARRILERMDAEGLVG